MNNDSESNSAAPARHLNTIIISADTLATIAANGGDIKDLREILTDEKFKNEFEKHIRKNELHRRVIDICRILSPFLVLVFSYFAVTIAGAELQKKALLITARFEAQVTRIDQAQAEIFIIVNRSERINADYKRAILNSDASGLEAAKTAAIILFSRVALIERFLSTIDTPSVVEVQRALTAAQKHINGFVAGSDQFDVEPFYLLKKQVQLVALEFFEIER